MDLNEELLEIASRHEEELNALLWASEKERWAELVFCILNAYSGDSPRCRELTVTLQTVGLVEPAALAKANDPTHEHGTVLRYLLVRYDFPSEQASQVASVLSRVASVVEDKYGGKVQRYLRRQGELIRDDLLSIFGDEDQPDSHLRQGVTHWLQNAAGIPLSMMDSGVREFCDAHGIDQQQLERAADEIDFNLALVDDVIKADRAAPND